jgi:hypothetical protein
MARLQRESLGVERRWIERVESGVFGIYQGSLDGYETAESQKSDGGTVQDVLGRRGAARPNSFCNEGFGGMMASAAPSIRKWTACSLPWLSASQLHHRGHLGLFQESAVLSVGGRLQ